MSRRRYISTNISIDKKINTLATEYGDFAALLYTWMIPHAGDDATLTGDPDELLAIVIPMRRDKSAADVEQALAAMESLGLIERDGEGGQISFPSESFYRYQSYIKEGGRRGAKNSAGQEQSAQDSAQNNSSNGSSANQRKSAQNAVSVSSSLSSSLSSSATAREVPPSEGAAAVGFAPGGDGFDPTEGRSTREKPLDTIRRLGTLHPDWLQEANRVTLKRGGSVGEPTPYKASILRVMEAGEYDWPQVEPPPPPPPETSGKPNHPDWPAWKAQKRLNDARKAAEAAAAKSSSEVLH